MFGLTRRRATAAAVEQLRPVIGSLQHSAGLPSHFWTTPYVSGFFQFLIGHHAKAATNGKIAGEDLGRVLADAFTALSNMNGMALATRSVELANAANPDFNRGADDAAAIAFFQMGRLKNEASHPLVVSALRLAGPSPDRSRVAAMMFMASIYREVTTE